MCGICGYSNCDWEDDYDEEYEDDKLERDEELRQERYAECQCGAYQYSKSQGRFIQVADCICGKT